VGKYSKYASIKTKGFLLDQVRKEKKRDDNRDDYERDRDRIIHSNAFRRLEFKTQVHLSYEDHYRKRLTHTLEVMQISRRIARELELNEVLAEAIALGHDLGHTPFGHAVEDELDSICKDKDNCIKGRFAHNYQSVRVVDKLEEKYHDEPGLNLTLEVRDGILKHTNLKEISLKEYVGEIPHKGQENIDTSITCPITLEGQVVALADEIAQRTHDLDDALQQKIIENIDDLNEIPLLKEQLKKTNNVKDKSIRRKEFVSGLVKYYIEDAVNNTKKNMGKINGNKISSLIVRQSDGWDGRVKTYLKEKVYDHYKVRSRDNRAKYFIQRMFNALKKDPTQLKDNTKLKYDKDGERAIVDYIAGMTDRYAHKVYMKLFYPPEITME